MSFPVPPEQTAWFALTVKPRHEKAAAKNLSARGLEPFVPLYTVRRRWSDRTKEVQVSLFPGYVFCRFGYEHRLDVLNLPSVTSIVGFGNAPAPIPDSEIDAIRSIVDSGRPYGPWPFLKVGQQVRIEQGALAGIKGILLREKDSWRVVVSVELLQRSVAVEIDRAMISPVL